MEFRTAPQFDIGYTQSPYGGVGNSPTPQTFSYNGNGQGYYSTMPGYNSGFQTPPGGYVGSYNPQYSYNPYASYYQQTQPAGPIFDDRVRLEDQFYFQQGYQPIIVGLDGREQRLGGNNYYANAWDLYNQRKQQEEEWKQQQQVQREIRRRLTILNRNFYGYDDGDEYFQKQEQYDQQQIANQYDRAKQEQEIFALQRLATFPNSSQPNYVNYERQQYIERWNKLFQQRTQKYQGKISVYEFFNGGVGNEMWIDMLTEKALDRAKDMTRLYNRNDFRRELAKSNPNYDPLTGTASGTLTLNNMSGSRGLNIDDMEITLPPTLSNDEYAKKRQKFMDTILSNMRDNVSPLANQQYAKEMQYGAITNPGG